MNILFASNAYFSHNNGTSVSAQRFVNALRENGHEVRVISNYDQRPLPEENMYVLETMRIPGFNNLMEKCDFSYAKPDEQIIREAIKWADVVHMMMCFPLEWACARICIEEHKPMTGAFHVQMENITSSLNMGKIKWLNTMLYKWINHKYYSKHKFVHCPSQFMKEELERYGYTNDLRAISNGVAPQFIYRRPPEQTIWGDKFVILMVGRLSHEKRQDLIIQAVAESRHKNQIQLVFAGNGPLKEWYKELCKDLPIQPVFGYYTQQQLIEIMAQTDLYIHASDMESEAIGCIEAFSTGLIPIISDSRLSATRQFALTDKSLFHAGDAHDLCKKIDYWFEHQKELPEWELKYADLGLKYQLKDSVSQFENMLMDAIEVYGQ